MDAESKRNIMFLVAELVLVSLGIALSLGVFIYGWACSEVEYMGWSGMCMAMNAYMLGAITDTLEDAIADA